MFSRNIFTRMSTASSARLRVRHDKKAMLFYVEIPDCTERAILSYDKMDSVSLDLQHTVVPEAFRGQGVGKLLAKAALDFVVENDLRMKLTCWFLQKYVGENPKEDYVKRCVN